MLNPRSNTSFLKRFYDRNLDDIIKLRKDRSKMAADTFFSPSTISRFPRPSSESRLIKPISNRCSIEKPSTEKKILKHLSKQLKDIQEEIANLTQRKTKNSFRPSLKVLTEPAQDPKKRIFNQVLFEIQEVKKKRKGAFEQPKKQQTIYHSPLQEQVMFYGVDLIDGIQFKIKVKLDSEKYCLMAKNTHVKLMLEMKAQEYLHLHKTVFKSNPCGIFPCLTISNDQLHLKIKQLKRSRSVKKYLMYY